MSKLFELSRKFLAGELPITENFKYSMIVYPVAAVHAAFFFFFLFIKVPPMTVYSLLSATTYMFCTIFLRMQTYSYIYFVASGEIILNTILTTWLMGWECGFASYLFVLVTAGFFISYTFRQHQITAPAICCIFSTLTYFICYYCSYHYTAPYAITDSRILVPLYIFNTCCTFVFIAIFSILFMMEMRVSQKKLFQENQMLGQIAGNDALTGLYNRWSMKNVLEEAVQSGNPFCLVMCDIDDFKHINDTYGHGCGDEVLKHISELLLKELPKDCYVCRWGGEEFLLLLNGYSLDSAAKVSDRIRRIIAANDTIYEEKTIPHTLTMGIAHHHKNQTLDSLLSRADVKLYMGKRQGKNVVVS